jgi:Synergist-CTERM protein sorting domain-containing protein
MGTIEGIGITELDVASVAGSRDWTGAFVEVGTPTYPATGCDLSQGCDTSSCSGGCSQGGSGGGALLLLAPLAVAALRRRR